MGDMIQYFHGDVKRINHALKVYYFASLISKSPVLMNWKNGFYVLLHYFMISGLKRQNKNTSHLQENTRSRQNPRS